MGGKAKKWTPREKFKLLRYSSEGVEEISEDIERSEIAIKSMARKLDMGICYVSKKEKVSHRKFCNDCMYNKKNCGKNVEKCLQEADLYKKFFNIK